MAIVLKRVSNLPFAPIVAGLFALAAAVLVMATPTWLLEGAVARLGIDSVLAAAAPPLGAKARALLAILAAFGTGAVLWLGLAPMARLLEGKRKSAKTFKEPVADFHIQNATAQTNVSSRRRPIFADRELGAPFMSEEALQDAPLLPQQEDADFDANELVLEHPILPAATKSETIILEAPERQIDTATVEPFGEAMRSEPFTSAPAWEGKRFELKVPVVDDEEPAPASPDFAVAAPSIPLPPPSLEHQATASIDDMVSRLERGLARRAAAISAAQAAAEAAVAVQAVHQAAPQQADASQSVGPLETAQKEVDSALRQALSTLERLAAGSR